MRPIYLLALLALLLPGCGHKGPLYLPQKPQPNTGAEMRTPPPAPEQPQEKQP